MTGLAFPQDANFNREASYEDGTPISNGDDIPIDPALTGVIDPVLMAESNTTLKEEQRRPQIPQHNLYPPQQFPNPNEIDQVRQYSQGPQGDPFAPQLLVPYHPYEALLAEQQQQQQQQAAAKQKRKRKVKRDEECGFCSGTDQRNKEGQPERMLTCLDCGRSGHPSCMQLQGDSIFKFPWRCIECKICELCHLKGDDALIMFCDRCDRGWHTYCFVPPLREPPKGSWMCPGCPSLSEGVDGMMTDHTHPGSTEMLSEDAAGSVAGGTSVASTSRSARQDNTQPREPVTKGRKPRQPGKSKGRTPRSKHAPAVEEDEDAMDVEEAVAPVLSKSAPRNRKRSRVVREAREVFSEDDEEELPSSPMRSRRRKAKNPSPVHSLPRVRLRLPTNGKGKGKEREEVEGGMFDDILTEGDRDTSKTEITRLDTLLFERSRQIAEEKLKPMPPPGPPPTTGRLTTSEIFDLSTPGPSRPLRSAALHHISTNVPATPNGLSASPGPSTPGGPLRPAADPNALRIHTIRFGEYDIKTWYDAPFPEEYATIPDGRLWICEFCLKYMKSRFGALRHRIKCKARHPPGDEIYRDAAVSIFEVDGRRNKIYCQNLCLLSKMFLDHKSLFYDVEPFLFYVITELDDVGHRFVGYFSKEKRSPKDYNVSCIMTLPVRQRKGWGNLLIDFSYLLSKKEERTGSPEKPLSNLGAIGYRKYWTLALMRYLEHAPDQVRLKDISFATSMTLEDICQTLTEQNMLYVREPSPVIPRPSPGQAIKFPKGRKNGVARRQLQRLQTQDKESDSGNKGPFVPPNHYEIHFDRDKVAAYLKDWESKGYLKLKPEKLQWTPYLLSRTGQENGLTSEASLLAASMEASSSSSSGQQQVMPPNGAEESEPSGVLDLFSPPPEDLDELPVARIETRSRNRSSKKSPSKSKKRKPSPVPPVADDLETPRRLRGRASESALNGLVSPASERPTPMTGRKPRTTRTSTRTDEGELVPTPLRSSRSRPLLQEPPPKKPTGVRKRRRVASPEKEEEEEEEEGIVVDIVDEEEEEAESSEATNEVQTEASSEVGRSDVSEVVVPFINGFGVHAESDLRSTLIYAEEDMHDEDAEGEEDLDAEGEVDPDY